MLRAALVTLLLALLLVPAAQADSGGLLAGAASADITAPVGTPMFAYTARSYIFSPDPNALSQRALQLVADPDTGLYAKTFEPSNGIHTRVLSRAIVLRTGDGQKYALAQADLGGLPYAMEQEVLKRITATGIDGDHLLLSATHSHSSIGDIWPLDNNGYAFVGGDAFDPRIFEEIAQGIATAIISADRNLRPAKLGIGTTQLTDASRNREFEPYQRDTEIKNLSPAEQRQHSIDPTMTVLRVDTVSGQPLALWSNFAIHPTSFGDGNLLFSGDNAGVSARLAEQRIAQERTPSGAGLPPVVDVWTNAAEGDTSPDGDQHQIDGQDADYINSDAAKADMAGERTAAGIVSAWRAAGDDMTRTPDLTARRTFFSFDGSSYGGLGGKQEPVSRFPVLGAGVVSETRPDPVASAQAGQEVDQPDCAPTDDFAGPGQGQKMPLVTGPGLTPSTVPVSFWRIDGQGIAAFPAEITHQMGIRIKNQLLQDSGGALSHVAIAGLTGGYVSYTATPEEYDACTYEGSFTLFGREEGYAWLAAGAELEQAALTHQVAPTGTEPPELALGTTQSTPPRATPNAGTAVTQPTDVARYGHATFSFNGGDPQVDAPNGRTFVALQRQTDDGSWETVSTDDTFADTVQRAAGDVWTETYQFDGCTPLGTYRFRITGRAVLSAGSAPVDYTLDSKPFAVGVLSIAVPAATTNGDTLSVRPLYPNPGAGALLALPRLVRDADVRIGGVRATDDQGDGTWSVPAEKADSNAVTVTDSCGNSGASA